MTESGSSSVAFWIWVMQCCTNQCGLPCKYSGMSFLIMSTTLEGHLSHVTYLKYRSCPRNTVADFILPVTYKYPPQAYFAICTGTKTLMSRYINLDIDILQQQLRKGILKCLVLCLSAIVCVVIQLVPNTECLNPHLQNKKKTTVAPAHRNYNNTLWDHTSSGYLLLWCPLLHVVVAEVWEPRPYVGLLQVH